VFLVIWQNGVECNFSQPVIKIHLNQILEGYFFGKFKRLPL